MAEITFDRLTKRFGQSMALDALSLVIPDGSLTCLLGPSGCGKTTTLRLLAGFMTPDDGEIRVGGRTVSSARSTVSPDKRDMSMIFQSYALWPHRTIAENVGYGLKQRRVPAPEIAQRVREALALVQLETAANRYPGELSGGQQQRVALARAVVVKPETLLLDEPLSNLDANLREEMRAEIRRLHDLYRFTTVYVTHDQTEAMKTADQVALLNGGRIAQFGTPEDIYKRPADSFVARFIGGANILKAQGLDSATVRIGDVAIACGSGDAAKATVLAIRPHLVTLGREAGAANSLPVRVVQHAYVGAFREYVVETGWGEQLTVTTPETQIFAIGDKVTATLPPGDCRALER